MIGSFSFSECAWEHTIHSLVTERYHLTYIPSGFGCQRNPPTGSLICKLVPTSSDCTNTNTRGERTYKYHEICMENACFQWITDGVDIEANFFENETLLTLGDNQILLSIPF